MIVHIAGPNRTAQRLGARFGQICIACIVLLCLPLTSCHSAWETSVIRPDGSAYVVDPTTLQEWAPYAEEQQDREAIPLEHVLWTAGHKVIERLVLTAIDGTVRVLDWPEAADKGAWWFHDGVLSLAGESGRLAQIGVQPPAQLGEVEASITDLAPTAAAALGLPSPALATGKALDVPDAQHVLLLFLDGFGYQRHTQAHEDGDIPILSSLGKPLLALTTYPPVTSVSTASLLTGAPPQVHGAGRRGIRKTDVETLFDVATAAGREVVAVEGEALAFQLRNAQWQLSGDRDGNGSTDDNVWRNALAILREGMPDLLFVHLHGIDDAGHTYGPGAPEERAAIREQDTIVGDLLAALPEETLVLIFADHGMHHVNEPGRLGNHGHLVAEDMLIPIFVWFK